MKLENEKKLEIAKEAFRIYNTSDYYGMCASFVEALKPMCGHITSKSISDYIPEFTPEFFGLEVKIKSQAVYDEYWWCC